MFLSVGVLHVVLVIIPECVEYMLEFMKNIMIICVNSGFSADVD